MKQNLNWLKDIIKARKEHLLVDAIQQYNEGLITQTEMKELENKNHYALEHVQELEKSIKQFIEDSNKLTEKK